MMGINIKEFIDASVSFELESPTVPLSEVFFPSLTICNMNLLRRSFVDALIKDEDLKDYSYTEIHKLLDEIFVKVS